MGLQILIELPYAHGEFEFVAPFTAGNHIDRAADGDEVAGKLLSAKPGFWDQMLFCPVFVGQQAMAIDAAVFVVGFVIQEIEQIESIDLLSHLVGFGVKHFSEY